MPAPLSYWWNHLIIPINASVVPIASVRESSIAVFSTGICRGVEWLDSYGRSQRGVSRVGLALL